MTDIVEFLTARLRDDEAYALEAAKEFGPDWIEIWSGTVDLSANLPERQPPAGSRWDAHVPTNDSGVSRHIARHDPARVLREVAAKRRVLARHSAVNAYGSRACDGCGWDREDGHHVEDIEECPELRDMASVYDDHPDYEQAWGVEA